MLLRFLAGKKLVTNYCTKLRIKNNAILKPHKKFFSPKTYLLTGTDFDVQLLVIKGISLGT